MAASHNIDKLDPQVEGLPLVRSVLEGQQVDCVMSNSFGFGGANASLLFSRRGLQAHPLA
ncbi:3-oxoacyl-[acyl-carrier-protein] synthase 1 [compost metagenome]